MTDADLLISCQGVSKKFCSDMRRSLRYAVRDAARDFFSRKARQVDLRPKEFWAIRDVSFDVHRGEAVAVMGLNGAGKSTLLKLILGSLRLTEGRVETRGSLGCLSDMGLGFDFVLSGRENAYMAAAVLGIDRKEIDDHFDEIVEFSGLKDFIDSPVQIYSAGMKTRLGFSIAMFLKPEVLLVDEVLVVGDVGFQRACVRRTKEYLDGGGSLVFVSHNPTMVQAMCSRCILIDHGEVVFNGDAVEGVGEYLKLMYLTPDDDVLGTDAPDSLKDALRDARREEDALREVQREEAAVQEAQREEDALQEVQREEERVQQTVARDAAEDRFAFAKADAARLASHPEAREIEVIIEELAIEPVDADCLRTGAPARVCLRYRARRDVPNARWGFVLATADLETTITADGTVTPAVLPGGSGEISCIVPRLPLVGGRYALRGAVVDAEAEMPLAERGYANPPVYFEVELKEGFRGNYQRFNRELVVLEDVVLEWPSAGEAGDEPGLIQVNAAQQQQSG